MFNFSNVGAAGYYSPPSTHHPWSTQDRASPSGPSPGYLVIEHAQHGTTPPDPVVFGFCAGDSEWRHKIGGVSGRRQRSGLTRRARQMICVRATQNKGLIQCSTLRGSKRRLDAHRKPHQVVEKCRDIKEQDTVYQVHLRASMFYRRGPGRCFSRNVRSDSSLSWNNVFPTADPLEYRRSAFGMFLVTSLNICKSLDTLLCRTVPAH